MSQLVFYELDRDALKQLSAELTTVLHADDRAALAALLGVEPDALGTRERLVDAFLLPESAAPELWTALRRTAKRRALTPGFTSDSPALEGRLRAFDAIRDDGPAAAAVDKLLSAKRLPWYLRAPGATCGWLDGAERDKLAARLERLRPQLTPELAAFARGIAAIDGDVVAHDAL
jgi:hypothetical protein